MQTSINLLRTDENIVINKKLAHKIGIDAAVLYSELLGRYESFRQRGTLRSDEYFYNTITDIQEAITLTAYQQRKAIKTLETCGLILSKVCGLPAKRYFKILTDERT
uniref:Uncharacterized protein n=1 Tax=viral metagenome TaxID=1070528 RepID=A0A6H1ZM95_9ZZZZ